MLITEANDYIYGRKFTGEIKREPFRGSEEFLLNAKRTIEKHPTAKENLRLINHHKVFFAQEPDLANDVPKQQQEEFFYGLKLGYISPVIPARVLHILDICANKYGSCNFLLKLLNDKDIERLFSKGYIKEGFCLYDIICSLHTQNYKPLESGTLIAPNKEFYDMYIVETDMVAIIPERLKEKLNPEDIRRIKVDDKTHNLMLGDKNLYELANYIGISESTYDLRNLI